jgi:signal transduction histidine kinase
VSLTLAAQGRSDTVGREQVLEASAAIRSSIKSLRSLLVEIYPPNLQEEGLESAIGDLLSGVAQRGIETRLVADLGGAAVDPEAAALVYRAAQEALRNVVAHSAATQVRVELAARDGAIALAVDDDGRGFSVETLDARAGEGHVGLRSVAGLVADLGGTFDVRSAPGDGTRVSVSLPVDARIRR